jgi:hypothetical protein
MHRKEIILVHSAIIALNSPSHNGLIPHFQVSLFTGYSLHFFMYNGKRSFMDVNPLRFQQPQGTL